jgi:hypothetical protein
MSPVQRRLNSSRLKIIKDTFMTTPDTGHFTRKRTIGTRGQISRRASNSPSADAVAEKREQNGIGSVETVPGKVSKSLIELPKKAG